MRFDDLAPIAGPSRDVAKDPYVLDRARCLTADARELRLVSGTGTVAERDYTKIGSLAGGEVNAEAARSDSLWDCDRTKNRLSSQNWLARGDP